MHSTPTELQENRPLIARLGRTEGPVLMHSKVAGCPQAWSTRTVRQFLAFLPVFFAQPYARIGDVMDRCEVSRPTAAGWLNDLVAAGMLTDVKVGRDRLFLNTKYLELLAERGD